MSSTPFIIDDLVDRLRYRVQHLRGLGEKRLPSEQELSKEYEVDRYRIRRALQRLTTEGVVHPVRGQGWFLELGGLHVRPHADSSFTQLAKQAGEVPRSALITVEMLYSDTAVTSELGYEEPQVVWYLYLLRSLGRFPFSLTKSYLPICRFPDLGDHIHDNQSLHDLLKCSYGVSPKRLRTSYEAVAANGEQARRLAVPSSYPLMKSSSLNVDEDGEAVEFCVSVFRADRFKVEIHVG